MAVQLSKNELNWISLLLEKTGAMAKDCIIGEDSVTFLLEKGDTGRVIGKRGANIKQLSLEFNREVQVVEFSDNLPDLTKNSISPVKPINIQLNNNDGKQTLVVTVSAKDKPRAIGKNASVLKRSRAILKRHYNIDNVYINVEKKSNKT
jgi:N utilization substance protein A